MKKYLLMLVVFALTTSLLTGCVSGTLESDDSGKNEVNQDINDNGTNSNDDVYKNDENIGIENSGDENNNLDNVKDDEVSTNDSINIEESSVSSPLKMGETGLIYADNTVTNNPEKVYITISELIKGSEADGIIEEYSSSFKPKEGIEYVIIKYDLDMKDYPTEFKKKVYVSASVKGLDGGNIKLDDNVYISLASDITEYNDARGEQGDVLHRTFVVPIPDGYLEDFLLVFNWDDENSDEHQTYFEIKNYKD